MQFDDDKETFEKSVKYFFTDLLKWYGGRSLEIPYNEIDTFILPIIVSLSRQTDSVADVMKTVEDYVVHIRSFSDYDDNVKETAIQEAFSEYIRGLERNHEIMSNIGSECDEFEFTEHKRGEIVEGYKRLFLALVRMEKESAPAKLFYRLMTYYLPELNKLCPDITEEKVDILQNSDKPLERECTEKSSDVSLLEELEQLKKRVEKLENQLQGMEDLINKIERQVL